MSDARYHTLAKLLADTYAVYLKTQNYHWHVKGPFFKSHHVLFEEHYTELALAVDAIAERILMLGYHAPATFRAYAELTSITEGNSDLSSDDMIKDLSSDHRQLIQDLYQAIEAAQGAQDEGTLALLSERVAHHEKMAWMLQASQADAS
jgi:starvation-inducible DNA-binding protein